MFYGPLMWEVLYSVTLERHFPLLHEIDLCLTELRGSKTPSIPIATKDFSSPFQHQSNQLASFRISQKPISRSYNYFLFKRINLNGRFLMC